MLITVSDILSGEVQSAVLASLHQLRWEDGGKTAGRVAREVKRNEQAVLSDPQGRRLQKRLQNLVLSHPVISAFAQPAKMTSPIISRTCEQGGYGFHVDNPFIGSGPDEVRSDLSFTLFLSPPDSYQGGELCIDVSGMTHRVKGEVGDLVMYPSTTLHTVEPVLSGQRMVCIGWIQSRIRRNDEREILFDLINLKAELAKNHEPNSLELLTLTKTMANLKRLWSD